MKLFWAQPSIVNPGRNSGGIYVGLASYEAAQDVARAMGELDCFLFMVKDIDLKTRTVVWNTCSFSFHRVPLVACVKLDTMELMQRPVVPYVQEIDLEERVRLIVELWGEGEALDESRIAEVARNLYGVGPEEVREAIISNLRKGGIKGMFYIADDSRSRASSNGRRKLKEEL